MEVFRAFNKMILRVLRRLAVHSYCLRRRAYSEPLRFILLEALSKFKDRLLAADPKPQVAKDAWGGHCSASGSTA